VLFEWLWRKGEEKLLMRESMMIRCERGPGLMIDGEPKRTGELLYHEALPSANLYRLFFSLFC
jgi:hypothetical protein